MTTPQHGLIVAIDIVGYSHNASTELWLLDSRRQLFDAVSAALGLDSLMRRSSKRFICQYLGDELRLAFTDKDELYAEKLVERTFEYLSTTRKCFTIRAAISRGTFQRMTLFNCTYLTGEAVDSVTRLLSTKELNGKLISNTPLINGDKIDGTWQRTFYPLPHSPQLPPPDGKISGPHHIVLAIGLTPVQEDMFGAMSVLANHISAAAINSGLHKRTLYSVGPSAFLIAIQAVDCTSTLRLVLELQKVVTGAAATEHFALSTAISAGLLQTTTQPLVAKTKIFEGVPAIAATRILSQLPPHSLAIEDNTCLALFKDNTAQLRLTPAGAVLGKHDTEIYPIHLSPRFFAPTDKVQLSESLLHTNEESGEPAREPHSQAHSGTPPAFPSTPMTYNVVTSAADAFKCTMTVLLEVINKNAFLLDAESNTSLSAYDRWMISLFRIHMFDKFFRSASELRTRTRSLGADAPGIVLSSPDRRQAAMWAISLASSSIDAVSVANKDAFWHDTRYLAVQVARKKEFPSLSIRRIIIGNVGIFRSRKTSATSYIEDQRQAGIDVRIISPKTAAQLLASLNLQEHYFHNILIVDDKIMTRETSNGTGDAVWDPTLVRRESAIFDSIWSVL